MPIYEYECRTCGEEFEVIQKFSDPPLKKHACSPKSMVNRKISLNAFQLKGGGWYNEGYSNGNGASPDDGGKSEASSKDKTGSGSDDGGKSESSSKDKTGSGSEKKTSVSDAKASSSSAGKSKSSGASHASS